MQVPVGLLCEDSETNWVSIRTALIPPTDSTPGTLLLFA